MNSPIDFEDLVNNELDELYLLANKELKIPKIAINKYMGSYFFHLLEINSEKHNRISLAKSKNKEDTYYSDFKKLCKLAPHVPILCLQSISMANGCLGALFGPPSRRGFINNNEKEVINSLLFSSYVRGSSRIMFELRTEANNSADETEQQKRLSSEITSALMKIKNEQSKKLSVAGLMGAKSKNRPFETLKKWALEKANGMQASHRDIARRLYAELPPHLENISDDPMRLIYDTLRAKKKSN